jgi:D-alanyl-D-alanine carboxypeptidase
MTSRSTHLAQWRWTGATAGLAASAVAMSLIAAGCDSRQHAASPVPASAPSQHTPAPAPTATVPAAATPARTATPPAGPVFQASMSVLTAGMRARMTGVSWHQDCPASLDRLRLLRLSYWGIDHAAHQGELVISASAAADLTHAFRLLFAARFPIRQMRVVDDFGGDDERSMLADNTSAFNCRLVPGTNLWSQHAYGLAVDINPFENPEIAGGNVDPPAASVWADRSRSSPAMIAHGDPAWRAFSAIGWTWGGDWQSPKDYMHFSANGL